MDSYRKNVCRKEDIAGKGEEEKGYANARLELAVKLEQTLLVERKTRELLLTLHSRFMQRADEAPHRLQTFLDQFNDQVKNWQAGLVDLRSDITVELPGGFDFVVKINGDIVFSRVTGMYYSDPKEVVAEEKEEVLVEGVPVAFVDEEKEVLMEDAPVAFVDEEKEVLMEDAPVAFVDEERLAFMIRMLADRYDCAEDEFQRMSYDEVSKLYREMIEMLDRQRIDDLAYYAELIDDLEPGSAIDA